SGQPIEKCVMLDAAIESMQLLAKMPVRRMDDAHEPSLLSPQAHPASPTSRLAQGERPRVAPLGYWRLRAQCRMFTRRRPAKSCFESNDPVDRRSNPFYTQPLIWLR